MFIPPLSPISRALLTDPQGGGHMGPPEVCLLARLPASAAPAAPRARTMSSLAGLGFSDAVSSSLPAVSEDPSPLPVAGSVVSFAPRTAD